MYFLPHHPPTQLYRTPARSCSPPILPAITLRSNDPLSNIFLNRYSGKRDTKLNFSTNYSLSQAFLRTHTTMARSSTITENFLGLNGEAQDFSGSSKLPASTNSKFWERTPRTPTSSRVRWASTIFASSSRATFLLQQDLHPPLLVLQPWFRLLRVCMSCQSFQPNCLRPQGTGLGQHPDLCSVEMLALVRWERL